MLESMKLKWMNEAKMKVTMMMSSGKQRALASLILIMRDNEYIYRLINKLLIR